MEQSRSIDAAIQQFHEEREAAMQSNADTTRKTLAALRVFEAAFSIASNVRGDILTMMRVLEEGECDPYAPHLDEVLVRPWGHMEIFDQTKLNPVRRGVFGLARLIHIKAGQALSRQSHDRRDEYFLPLDQHCLGELDKRERVLTPGELISVPRGHIHRISAATSESDTNILELALSDGIYRQDDIRRYDDRYGRPALGE